MKFHSLRKVIASLNNKNSPFVRVGHPTNYPLRRREELNRLGFHVESLYIDPEDYKRYMVLADYPDIYGKFLPEKSLEHYASLKLLDFVSEDIFIDIASSGSPFPGIVTKLFGCTVYKQDLAYPRGLHCDSIGSHASSIPLPPHSITKMTLHCSFEHFEGDEDSKFIIEAARLLQPHGTLCILPLYFADEYSILTDPTVNRQGVKWDRDATIFNNLDYGNRFGRFYTVQKLKERILDLWDEFTVKFFFVENEKEIHQSCYLQFVMVLEKSPRHQASIKYRDGNPLTMPALSDPPVPQLRDGAARLNSPAGQVQQTFLPTDEICFTATLFDPPTIGKPIEIHFLLFSQEGELRFQNIPPIQATPTEKTFQVTFSLPNTPAPGVYRWTFLVCDGLKNFLILVDMPTIQIVTPP